VVRGEEAVKDRFCSLPVPVGVAHEHDRLSLREADQPPLLPEAGPCRGKELLVFHGG